MNRAIERFSSRVLIASERPRHFYEYVVTGSGAFPFDMLRYDHCWPATGEDAGRLDTMFGDRESRQRRSIKMWSYNEPTTDRWSSFGWSVGARSKVGAWT